MSRISFFKHSKALKDAYQDVLNDSTDTDWAIFTYDGKENELKVVDTGDGGLEELEDEFNGSKIMYAFARVKDPNTSLNKFLLINWQGDGAPAARKGMCANHVSDVARFFQGAHITLTCRNDDEVTANEILKQVSKASASTYSFNNRSTLQEEANAPVGSVYQRVNPQQEISSTKKETFWQKQEREEEERKKAELAKVAEDRRRYQQEIKENEKMSNDRRKEWEKSREKEITEKMRAQKLADSNQEYRQKEKENWEAQQREMEQQDQRGRKRSESVEKAAEAASLVSNRGVNPKSLWEQRINEANKEPEIQRSYNPPPRRTFEDPQTKYQEEPQQSYEPAPAQSYNEPEPTSYNEPEQPTYDEAGYDESHQQGNDSAFDDGYGQEQPTNQNYQQDESTNQQSYAAEQTNGGYGQPEPQPENYNNEYDSVAYPEDNTPQDQVYEDAPGADDRPRARTLYDYQAADDTEITFDVDEIITDIVMVDEGWWEGRAPNGSFGLFPANYVELI